MRRGGKKGSKNCQNLRDIISRRPLSKMGQTVIIKVSGQFVVVPAAPTGSVVDDGPRI